MNDRNNKVEPQRKHACIMQVLDAADLHQGVEAASNNNGSSLPENILIASNESVYASDQKMLN